MTNAPCYGYGMGYSISETTYKRDERNRREGRACGWLRCHTRATVRQTSITWDYAEDKDAGKPGRDHVTTLCARHAADMPEGYQGANFTVTRNEIF